MKVALWGFTSFGSIWRGYQNAAQSGCFLGMSLVFRTKVSQGDSPAHVGSGQAVLKKVGFYLAQYSHLGIETWDTYVIGG